MVELDEAREKVYFRFYDPGVMRVFLGSCEEGRRAELFGRSRSWLIEQTDGGIEHLRSGFDGHA